MVTINLKIGKKNQPELKKLLEPDLPSHACLQKKNIIIELLLSNETRGRQDRLFYSQNRCQLMFSFSSIRIQ